jgi:hypothetical protein
MRIAQIVNNKAHWIFTTDETMEQLKSRFAPDIMFVDITGKTEVQESWDYDAATGNFSEPVITLTIEEQNASLISKIEAIEDKTARAIRELYVYAGSTDTDGQGILATAKAKLSEYETQIETLRAQLK